jgi:hypothetical protein
LLDLGDLMEQILIRHEEPLKFHVSLYSCTVILGSKKKKTNLKDYIIIKNFGRKESPTIYKIFLDNIRGADYRSVVSNSEKVQRIFNIFHPYDPEMFHENYKHIRPLKLFKLQLECFVLFLIICFSSHQDAIKSYESVIFECHQHYLKKCKSDKKKNKEAAATKNGKKRAKDENVTMNEKS